MFEDVAAGAHSGASVQIINAVWMKGRRLGTLKHMRESRGVCQAEDAISRDD